LKELRDMQEQRNLKGKVVKHQCEGWQCDFCPNKTCRGCGGVMDADGTCACKECQKKQKLHAPTAAELNMWLKLNMWLIEG
jgi:hypothetical protein